MGQLIQELKRRNVIRVAVAYAVAAWILIEVTSTIFPILSLPTWSVTLVTVFLLIGFPLVLVFSWAYEITPEGIKKEKDVERSELITRETAKKLDIAVIVLLLLAMGGLVVDRLIPDATTPATEATANSVAVASVPDQSIAVLPFADMSPEGDQEYFSDGISEELLNVLAKIPGLRVVARTSSFQFKGENRDIIDIGQKLNVAHVLEGSVRKAGSQIRVTAQLVDATTGFHLWSETYDRELENIFAVQDDISAAIVKALKVRLLDDQAEDLLAASTAPEAFEAYLLGKHLLGRDFTVAGIRSAAEQFERAVSIDPNYAPAWANRSLALRALAIATGTATAPSEKAYREAREYAERAIELDPDLDIAYRALGLISLDQFEFVAAKQNFERALSIGPGDAENIRVDAYLMLHAGQVEAAVSRVQESLELDPLSIGTLYGLAMNQIDLNNLADAEATLTRMETINSADARVPIVRSGLALRGGQFSVAIEHAEQIPDSRDYLKYMYLTEAHNKLGEQELADQYLKLLIDRFGGFAGREIAQVYAQRGEPDRAFEWLDRGWKAGDPGVTQINFDWRFEPLKEDPRFDAFVEKIGLKAIMTTD